MNQVLTSSPAHSRFQTQLSSTSSNGGGQRRSVSSNAAVAQRLFMSPTKSTTAKLRAERTMSDGRKMTVEMQRITGSLSTSHLPKRTDLLMRGDPADQDSGHFSSDEGSPGHQHHATSDDELSMEELRRRQRKERRDYIQRHSPTKGSSSRKESPSPAGPRFGERGRRSSDDGTSDTSSISPPPTPSPKTGRSTSSRPFSGLSGSGTLSTRRAKSSGNSPKKLQLGVKTCPYAFGSSQKRFFDDGSAAGAASPATQNVTSSPEGSLIAGTVSDPRKGNIKTNAASPGKKPSPLNKSSSDGVQNSIHQLQLNRSSSDSRVSSGKRVPDSTRESWLKFKDDVDIALQKKPNQSGFYKTLSDMMHNKMEMLDQVSK